MILRNERFGLRDAERLQIRACHNPNFVGFWILQLAEARQRPADERTITLIQGKIDPVSKDKNFVMDTIFLAKLG